MPSNNYLARWGYSEESTFGTAIADNGTFEAMTSAPPTPDYGVLQSVDIKHRNQVYADIDDEYTTQAGGLRVLPFGETPIRIEDLGVLLYSVTQSVTENGLSPYQKDYAIGTSWSAPDFSSNGGIFHTVGIRDTIASNHKKFTSCVLRSLTLKYDPSDGRLMASGEWVSGFQGDVVANFTGTWAPNTQTYLDFNAPTTKTVGGSNMLTTGWEITINNNVGRVGNDSSGDAENYKIGIPEIEITGSVSTIYDTNSDGFLADFLSGSPRAIAFADGGSGTGTAGYFDINLPSVVFTGNEDDYSQDVGRVVTLPFKAVGDGSTNGLMTAEVSDGVDQSW